MRPTTIQRHCLSIAIATMFAVAGVCSASESDLSNRQHRDSIDAAIEKSIPFIERGGTTWMDRRKCVSCHQVPFMVWSLELANENGFAVSDELANWTQWARDWKHFHKPENREKDSEQETFRKNTDTTYQLLLASYREPLTGEPESWQKTFVDRLKQSRSEEGDWKPQGQLPGQKRPTEETGEVTTMWSLLALSRFDPGQSYQLPNLNAKGISAEWWAVQMLLAAELGAQGVRDTAIAKLIDAQAESGGWGWLLEDEPDALGTGIVAWALLQMDDPKCNEAVSRAVQFLVGSQNQRGDWDVNGTKKNAKDRRATTASYWGSAWATIALVSYRMQQ